MPLAVIKHIFVMPLDASSCRLTFVSFMLQKCTRSPAENPQSIVRSQIEHFQLRV